MICHRIDDVAAGLVSVGIVAEHAPKAGERCPIVAVEENLEDASGFGITNVPRIGKLVVGVGVVAVARVGGFAGLFGGDGGDLTEVKCVLHGDDYGIFFINVNPFYTKTPNQEQKETTEGSETDTFCFSSSTFWTTLLDPQEPSTSSRNERPA